MMRLALNIMGESYAAARRGNGTASRTRATERGNGSAASTTRAAGPASDLHRAGQRNGDEGAIAVAQETGSFDSQSQKGR